MAYRIPFVDPGAHYQRLKPEIDRAIIGCLTTGDLVMRRALCEFEQHLADFVGTKFAVGVNSGYHALHFALLALGLRPGDEVIVPAHTFVASVSAIIHAGGTPVLVDVGDDHNIDPEAVQAAVTENTRAIMAVHLNGRMADMAAIEAIASGRGLPIVEDAAQALGATRGGRASGSCGIAGCFSFYPFKILGGFGDGGAITTNDAAVARRARLLRYNGEDRETGEYHYHGYTALLDNVQAAVLDVKLRHLPSWIEHRRSIARKYSAGLRGVGDLKLPRVEEPGGGDVFQNYVVETERRDALRAHLRADGIETLVHWPKPIWRHAGLAIGDPQSPRTEAICRNVVSLPLSAETTGDQVNEVVESTRRFFG